MTGRRRQPRRGNYCSAPDLDQATCDRTLGAAIGSTRKQESETNACSGCCEGASLRVSTLRSPPSSASCTQRLPFASVTLNTHTLQARPSTDRDWPSSALKNSSG